MAITSVPQDIADDLVPPLRETVCDYVCNQHPRVMIFDFSAVSAVDKHLMTELLEIGHQVRVLGTPVAITGISAGIASALAMMGMEDFGLPVLTGVDDCMPGMASTC